MDAVATMEEEHDIKPFFAAVRLLRNSLVYKFPFGELMTCDLEILLPGQLKTRHSFNKTLSTASYFWFRIS